MKNKIEQVYQLLKSCSVCPRNCGVDRTKGEAGFCGMAEGLMVSSFGPHYGEEKVLVGSFGSGTIFLTGCNLCCIFCQNYDISHLREGSKVTIEDFVNIVLALQNRGCHNINFVTPTHFTPQIMEAIYIARKKGLHLPTVYNCGGYESKRTLRLLEGFIDIYMPDAKFANSNVARELADAPDYPEIVKEALLEMHRQVGDLVCDKDGLAVRGLLIRHLVLPDRLAGTEEILDFIATEISKDTYVNIMDQYRPMYKAQSKEKIGRYITNSEYQEAVGLARSKGLHRGF